MPLLSHCSMHDTRHSTALPNFQLPSSPSSSPGVEVEVFTPPEASAAPRINAAEGMGPLQVGGEGGQGL